MDKRIEIIKDNDLFYGINHEDIQPMIECLGYSVKTYSKGEYVILEDDNVRCIGIVLTGKLNMKIDDVWGNRTTLMTLKPNEIFGETFACSYNTKSLISLQAACDTTILSLPFERVMHTCSMVCKFHHRQIENMVNLISSKNQELMRKLEVISKKSLREKIMAYLSAQAQLSGSNYFVVPMGRVELAEYLCADRSALTRELSKMKDEKIIDFDKNTFRLLI